jgi:hypothetical protein
MNGVAGQETRGCLCGWCQAEVVWKPKKRVKREIGLFLICVGEI